MACDCPNKCQEKPTVEVAKPAVDKKKLEQITTLKLITQAFPDRAGFVRKIKPLWANRYRVNFHEINNNNFIKESYHIVVTDKVEVEG